MTYQPNVICTSCAKEMHWLDAFPNQICLACHEQKHFNDTPEQMLSAIMKGFGGQK